jgi:hypothetical protein
MRSDPLILDKETGEPKYLTDSQQRYDPWKLVVKDHGKAGKRKIKTYTSYVEAKERAAEINERYGDRVEAHVVSRQLGYGPPYSKVSDRQMLDYNEQRIWWCPYCRKLRRFLYRPALEMKACEFCLTKETDWHVRMCNPILWEADYLKRMIYL